MAFKDYLAVLDSDLYEYCGTTKAILARIAHLIIAPPKEDEATGKQLGEPDPNVGWCVASQDYIACQYGLSVTTVRAAIRTFEQDKWLETVCERDKYGHDHNKYRWAEGAWERLKARERQKDEHREYVRKKQVNMLRYDRAHSQRGLGGKFEARPTRVNDAPSTRDSENPTGNMPAGQRANCAPATGQSARQPAGILPVELVGVGVELSKSEQSETKANGHAVAETSQTGQADQSPTQPQGQQPTPRGAAPNPAEASRLETPGTDVPVNSASPRPHSASPRTPKPTCQSVGCGGPLKGNKPDGVCLKCGRAPSKEVRPVKPRRVDPNARHRWPPRAQITPETICLNPGCGREFAESKYDRSPCDGEGADIAEGWRA